MLRAMRSLAGLGASRTLLKTAVRGGLLRLSSHELSHGEGVLGSRNVRRFPVASILAIEIEPMDPSGRAVRLRLRTAEGEALTLEGVNPVAARRLRELVAILRGERG